LCGGELPGFAYGYAVAFLFRSMLRMKNGGAERDRTVDLLNAIRGLVVENDPLSASAIDSVHPEIS